MKPNKLWHTSLSGKVSPRVLGEKRMNAAALKDCFLPNIGLKKIYSITQFSNILMPRLSKSREYEYVPLNSIIIKQKHRIFVFLYFYNILMNVENWI